MDIRVENLCKTYIKNRKEICVIDNFSYHFRQGKMYLIKGESGSGKTTLLTLLALLQNETSGNIFFDNKKVNTLNNEKKCKIRREEIGMVYQDFNLLDRLTVLENIILLDVCERMQSKQDAILQAEKTLSMLNLSHRANHYPFELSGGEQQRVGVARAIVKNPSILICDEPVSNLDGENTKKILEFINAYYKDNNKLCIVTSHDESFDRYANEIINL